MALAEKQNMGPLFLNRTGAMVNNIFPNDKGNKAFNKINGNIAGVDWKGEPP